MHHIYYYSWFGKTRFCAEAAARILNCGVTEIIEVVPRKKGVFGFLKSGYEASREKTSEIRELPDFEGDWIILAYPIWAGRIPPAINTTLEKLNVTGRRVLVINTMGGESESIPAVDQVRNCILGQGGTDVSFIRITTGRSAEKDWENVLTRELKRLELIG